MTLSEIEEKLQKILPARRFHHTQSVMYTSACLAMRWGEDMEKALYAGLLHDCAKYLKKKELYNECVRYGLPISKAEEADPSLLHGKVGAYYAEHIYGVTDPDILGAITYHTTGKPAMSLLEKIVFTADYIEPSRNQVQDLPQIRQLAFTDLDRAVLTILQQTLAYIRGNNQIIDDTTEITCQYYYDLLNGGDANGS